MSINYKNYRSIIIAIILLFSFTILVFISFFSQSRYNIILSEKSDNYEIVLMAQEIGTKVKIWGLFVQVIDISGVEISRSMITNIDLPSDFKSGPSKVISLFLDVDSQEVIVTMADERMLRIPVIMRVEVDI